MPRALGDDELQARVYQIADNEGAASAIAFLEEQARLRELDELEFAKWQLDNPPVYEPQSAEAAPDGEALQPSNSSAYTPPQEIISAEGVVAPYEVISADEEVTALELSRNQKAPESYASFEASGNVADVNPFIREVDPEAIENELDFDLEAEIDHPDQIQASRVAREGFQLSEVGQADKRQTSFLEAEKPTSGRSSASSLFWVWASIFAVGAPALSVSGLRLQGFSAQEALLATVIGFFGAGLAISVVSIAGKRSGLSTLVISRAAFGFFGNLIPATVVLLGKVLFSLVLGYLAIRLADSALSSMTQGLPLAVLIGLVILAGLFAGLGGKTLFRVQQISVGISFLILLSIVAIGLTQNGPAVLESEVNPIRVLSASALVFSVFGLFLSTSAGEFTRVLPAKTLGYKVTLWVMSAVFLLGSLAAAAFTFFAVGENILAIAAAGFGILVLLVSNQYSTSRSLSALNLNLHPAWSQALLGLLLLGVLIAGQVLGYLPTDLAIDYLAFAAVPISAWAGIFISDVLIRRIAYHEISLNRSYGFYKAFNVTNTIGFVLASGVGFGLIDSEIPALNWQGYLLFWLPNPEFWSLGNMAILTTFSIGVLLPLVFGIPRIKRQEREVQAIEARRSELLDVLGLVE